MQERGIEIDQTTMPRWIQAYSPDQGMRCHQSLGSTNDSWRVDETEVKVKGC